MSNNENIIKAEMEKLNTKYKVIEFTVTKNKWTNMPYIHVLMKKIED